MADTYTTNLNLTKPEPGAAEDTWGISLNADLDSLDAIFSSSGTQINLNPNQINFADGKKAIFGTGSDLEIFHDGNNSYIKDSGTGNLKILGSSWTIIEGATSGTWGIAHLDGAQTNLYHNGNLKLATTSTGIDVTGTVTSDGLTVDGESDLNATVTITHANPRIKLIENNSVNANTQISNDVGNFTISTMNDAESSFTSRLNIQHATGDISFYDDTGTSQSFFWDASAERLGLGTTSPDGKLDVNLSTGSLSATNSANFVLATLEATATSSNGSATYQTVANTTNSGLFVTYLSTDNVSQLGSSRGSSTQLVNTGGSSLRVGTLEATPLILGTNNAERMRISADGSVGIGTSSPGEKLQVDGNIRLGPAHTTRMGTDGTNAYFENFANGAVIFRTNNYTERMRINSSGNVGIGTTSPSFKTDLNVNSTSASDTQVALRIKSTTTANMTDGFGVTQLFSVQDSSGSNFNIAQLRVVRDGADDSGAFVFAPYTTGTASERMRIDSSGNVGIGTSSPNRNLHIIGQYTVENSTSPSGALLFTPSSDANRIYSRVSNASSSSRDLAFLVGSTEAMRIDSSGNLLVGKTATASTTVGAEIRPEGRIFGTTNNQFALLLNRTGTDGTIAEFRKDGSTVGSIGTVSNRLHIGSGNTFVTFYDTGNSIYPAQSNGTLRDNAIDIGTSSGRFKDLYLSGQVYINGTTPNIRFTDSDTGADSQITASSGYGALVLKADYNNETAGSYLGFEVDGSEAGRFDSSGNFLVDKTAIGLNTVGFEVRPNGIMASTRDGGSSAYFNRKTSDGSVVEFQKDGTTVGNIGCPDGANGSQLVIAAGAGGSNTGVGLRFTSFTVQNIIPCYHDGSSADNHIDLGNSGARFDDIYATNGTIQTSDRNEKQDIQALTDAEQRVATACKGLIRRFRWQDAVEEKGDDARLHFGVIAQDLQDAFEAEGLDAGDYGMFISSTWEDDDGVEQTRLGVRYSELLAFIIAAI